MSEIRIKVTGMNCNHCKMRVENALMKVEGIEKAIADVNLGEVVLTGRVIHLDQVKSAVTEAGYLYGGTPAQK
jgi:copper chaperone CopZ